MLVSTQHRDMISEKDSPDAQAYIADDGCVNYFQRQRPDKFVGGFSPYQRNELLEVYVVGGHIPCRRCIPVADRQGDKHMRERERGRGTGQGTD
jgi:hypothetical protein